MSLPEIDPLDLLTEYLTEHAYVSHMEGDTLVIGFGDADRVPPLYDDGLERALCGSCLTLLANRGSAGWCHEVGFKLRNACVTPQPRALPT